MNQSDTPLFSGLIQHTRKNPTAFHIPGHKGGKGIDPEFLEYIGHNALAIDLINIEPLDDLHHPKGMIKDAQDLAADAFGADHTFFSVQGTSGAIMTMILSVCEPGDKIIVPRNIHKSVTSALIFSGAIPIFIHPEIDHELGISHGITPNAVNKALHAHPDAKAVLVINPTYFGISADLKEIVRISHEHNIPVLVDEAHGVHIHFHDKLPLSAMQAGADMAATSVHKLGGSMTQSSVLNVREGLINHERVQTVMSMLTTTSTSYILLASLDVARKRLYQHGEQLLHDVLHLADITRNRINQMENLYCPGEEILGTEATYDYDPTKIIISVKDLGITGHDAEVWLRDHYNIEVELSDMYNILCILTTADTEEDIDYLLQALSALAKSYRQTANQRAVHVSIPEIPLLAVSPREAFYADFEIITLADSAGRISAESIMIYPPGIPIFIPGEIISEDNLQYIFKNVASGLPVQGLQDETLATIRVLKERVAFK
ncbi:aminotransferase class I/II-fold pyridoxal phosphate-dependent enzyme [Gracilibacillus caseinilyticus]|uniref:Aminotransferase class I/II-fold pyridoxal phosphate-dependent enzyme n=1 Tax=Gracilibacillus caseinilyticus TaxID=2932256 RepID=A0ABY4F403_9BACI|nr:aminotransferase class I/II-fold pyridoxal phosphate-dependent enzyme [Gracilibacillus caseinilyticus]UOQ50639.1 aminotransferase class I/II-fold pyridoxal phosphate-dependent enzyme [Gracilibacillus caseinilyticus]